MTRLDRVRQIVAGSGQKGSVEVPAPLSVSDPNGADSHLDVVNLLGGALESGPDGPCFVIRRTFEPAHIYGERPLGEYPAQSSDALDVLAGSGGDGVRKQSSRQVVCFDLETTGLSGGAGTVGFIVGLGWFDGRAFHTCQYFLSSLAHERRMLVAVAGVLRCARTIITFNGRSFDAPVAEMRYAFHGLASPLDDLRHVDLLHPSRHLWTADEGRLVSLERNVLGLQRVGDVSGAEIPGRYVGYLRSGDPRLLRPVLEHNRLDLVSLGVLGGLACHLVRTGAGATAGSSQALGLGRVYERAGRSEWASVCYQRAAGVDQPDAGADPSWVPPAVSGTAARAQALRRLARIHRREGRYADAADAWARLLRLSRIPTSLRHEASVALAVHHEHRLRDLRKAQQFAVSALEPDLPANQRQAVRHRLLRLRRKLDATHPRRDGQPVLQPK